MRVILLFTLFLITINVFSDVYMPDSGIWYETGEDFSGGIIISIHNSEAYEVYISSIVINYTVYIDNADGNTIDEDQYTKEFSYDDFVIYPYNYFSVDDIILYEGEGYFYWYVESITYTYKDPETGKILTAFAEYFDYADANPWLDGPEIEFE